MSNVKIIKIRAEVILLVTSGGGIVAEMDEDEIVTSVEQNLNSLGPLNLPSVSSHLTVGTRFHFKEKL